VVRARRGEGVGPFSEVGSEQGASKGKINDARAPNERHGKPGEDARDVKESEPQFCGPVEIGGRGGDCVLLEDPKGVGRGVMNIEVSQCECGKRGHRKYNIRGNRAGIVETALRAVGVDYGETSRRGVKKAVGGEEVQSHNITPSEKAG